MMMNMMNMKTQMIESKFPIMRMKMMTMLMNMIRNLKNNKRKVIKRRMIIMMKMVLMNKKKWYNKKRNQLKIEQFQKIPECNQINMKIMMMIMTKMMMKNLSIYIKRMLILKEMNKHNIYTKRIKKVKTQNIMMNSSSSSSSTSRNNIYTSKNNNKNKSMNN